MVEFLLPRNKTDGIQKIVEDNELSARGFQIEDIAWLKWPEKTLGTYVLMGIWFNSAEAADWIINNGLFIG